MEVEMSDLIKYVRTMPAPPEGRGVNTLVPMWLFRREIEKFIPEYNTAQTDPKKHRKITWGMGNESNIRRPDIGDFAHYAKVRIDDKGNFVEYVDDHTRWANGPLDPRTNLATPGVVTAPIIKKDGEYYVLWFWAWREATWDDRRESVPPELTDRTSIELYIAQHRGAWYPTIPGGWANAGEKIEAAAKREAREEMAIRLLFHDQDGRTVQDRSNGQTLVSVGFSAFEIIEGLGLTNDEGELVGKDRFATPIGQFYSEDALVMAAVDYAKLKLGITSSSPQTEEVLRFAQLCQTKPELARVLLSLVDMKSSNV